MLVIFGMAHIYFFSTFLFSFKLQPEVIEILVKSGADIDAKTRTGETPFGKFMFKFESFHQF
jgi:hypothetical protein